jgi:hypothetical protein
MNIDNSSDDGDAEICWQPAGTGLTRVIRFAHSVTESTPGQP